MAMVLIAVIAVVIFVGGALIVRVGRDAKDRTDI